MTAPRKHHLQSPHTLRGRVTFGQSGIATGVELGVIPAGSFVKPGIVKIEEAFNAATTNVLVVGSIADDDGFITSAGAAAGVLGVKTSLTGAQTGNVTTDTQVLVKFTQSGAAATAGIADIVLEYYPHST